MIEKQNERLDRYTTFKMGGLATNFYVPENKEELLDLSKKLLGEKVYVISGGSNLLITDKRPLENVIYMKNMDDSFSCEEDGSIVCGASMRIQKVIQQAKNCGLGGIEYLFSLPAMLGGIIVMNAGRGSHIGVSISDHIVEVYAIKDGKEYVFPKDECGFGYRTSIFKNEKYIITGAKLRLNPMTSEEVDKGIKERLELCKRVQDHSGGNFGSVFSVCNPRIMSLMKKYNSKNRGVHWSNCRGNWLINDGTGTFEQARKKIRTCKKIHSLFGKTIHEEVIIWE